jgi:hypothetical protein
MPQWRRFRIIKSSPEKVIMEAQGKAEGYNIEAKSRVDYDGFYWISLKFSSGKGKEIEGLRLDMAIKKQLSIFFQRATLRNYAFPEKGYSHRFSRPDMWVGNDKVGLQWFAQSDQYWYAKDPNKREEVFPTKDSGMMRINIINNPITMPKEFTISFGLEATPVKPRPQDWRSYNFSGIDMQSEMPWRLADPKRFKNLSLDYSWWSISPAWLIPPKTMKPRKYNPDSPEMWLPFSSTAFLGLRTYHTKDVKNILTAWRVYKNEWEAEPQSLKAQALGQSAPGWAATYNLNPSKSYIEMYLYYMNKFLKNYNAAGLYIDGMAGTDSSENLEDGFGYIDRNGNVKSTFPILAGRQLTRRMATILYEDRGTNGVMFSDTVDQLMPVLGFYTGTYDGECFTWSDLANKIKKDGWYSAVLTPSRSPGWIRAYLDMKQYGLIPTFDTRLYLTDANKHQNWSRPAKELFGILLANDIQSWCGETEGYAQYIELALDWWGITGRDVKFLPYWSKDPAVIVTNNSYWKNYWYASAYINRKEKKMLIVALNTSGWGLPNLQLHMYFNIKLNLKKLGLEGKNLRVTDAESFGTLKLPYKNGIIPLTMNPHGVKLISITWGGKKGHNFWSFLKDKSIKQ